MNIEPPVPSQGRVAASYQELPCRSRWSHSGRLGCTYVQPGEDPQSGNACHQQGQDSTSRMRTPKAHQNPVAVAIYRVQKLGIDCLMHLLAIAP